MVLAAAVNAQLGQGADGNPHAWDRQRRCDQSDYSPKCGVCEGYGGIPFGDDNNQITLSTCQIVATADQIDATTLKRPVWAKSFQSRSWEVLVGAKTDALCFQAFPSNTSAGPLCYRPQTGVQYYDFKNQTPGILREDIEIKTAVGNVTTTLVHQGYNFWIVNRFPWWALGVKQCICTQASAGGSKTSPPIGPIKPDWTKVLKYVGREIIKVEYDQGIFELMIGSQVLDHWAFSAHHVWSVPESGRILRMWQPFNGLQVFPHGTDESKIDPKAFEGIIPPPECKNWGSLIRIGCDNDGFPTLKKPVDGSGQAIKFNAH